jgi:hypothetical protein
MDSVLDFIDDDQRRHGTRTAFIQGRAFMIAYFALIHRPLPPVAHEALQVAQRYLAAAATSADLTAARVACWQYLDARHLTYAVPQSSEASVVRAAICFLWADPTDDAPGMGVDFFLSRANAAEDHSAQVDELIAAYFQ